MEVAHPQGPTQAPQKMKMNVLLQKINASKSKSLWMLGAFLLLAIPAFAQSEAESSTSFLQVRTQGENYKTMYTMGVGEKMGVKTGEDSKWIRGKIMQIQDSSVTIGEQTVPLSTVTEVQTRLEGETVFAGIVVFILAAGLGLAGWFLGKAMIEGRPDTWWKWTLAILGAAFIVVLFPMFLIGTIMVWALSQKRFEIGRRMVLHVYKKKTPQPPKVD